MAVCYKIKKVLTNNIVRAYTPEHEEVFLIGKGIGFGHSVNDLISSYSVENIFVMQNKTEQKNYEQLLQTLSPKIIELSNDIIDYIQRNVDKQLNEHIHIALTDHIAFLIRRCKMGLPIENPFSYETSTLYPKETKLAETIVTMLEEELRIRIPDGEIGFIALHIISSMTNDTIANMQNTNRLIKKLMSVLSFETKQGILENDLNYSRLITHLRFCIERVQRHEILDMPEEISSIISQQYPQSFNLAFKLITIIQNDLHKEVNQAEVFYLTLHLIRFNNIIHEN